ncbi:DUF1002 domain-containing protein [Bacillus sp. HNG]|uniref:DUF1002 domain-containing protein n=1 Tax=Bacillaceae TaxID=186817 RepID=UPI000E2ED783|nr:MULTISPECIES: DUF1002 domain-containing protein [Bacillaceae]MDR4888784.1 DUF1002 domain-containing protein [Fredinandcohnia sp. QZ13]RFB17037.1 DUF1002 domain-containing protein [Bacillus sp. HNG]
MRYKRILSFLLLFSLIFPSLSFADATPGDVILTLGQDLTETQKDAILKEMNAPENPQIVVVTNAEEHQYLGNYIPKARIGNKALSSASITIGEKGSGLDVTISKHITLITEEMYANALITAGVKDAKIYVTGPFDVSGTAALTGIIKAYEISSDQVIPEDVKQIANEEMVETTKLSEKIGAEDAAALMAKIKDEIAKNAPKNDEELRTIIVNAANDLGITLTDADIDRLMDLFKKLMDLNIDWNQVGEQLNLAKEKLTNFLESEEGQGFLDKLKEFFVSLIDAIKNLFK